MKIKDIRLRAFSIPLRGELRWGREKSLSSLDHLLVEVTLEGGHVGRGEIAVRPQIYGETIASVKGALEWLRGRLNQLGAGEPHLVRRALEALPYNYAAKAGVEMALWEARVAAQGKTLAEVLPPGSERVRVSFIVGQGDVASTLERARFAYERGVRVFKLKTSGRTEEDEERIRALYAAFPDAEVYVDANETLGPDRAQEILTRWRELGVTMVEEPLPVQRVADRRRLRSAGVLPLIADDSVFSLRDTERELELGTFDIINVKPARSGFGWSMEMLEHAREHGRGAMIGSQAMSSYGAARAALLAFHPAVDRPSELAFHLLADGGFAEFPPIEEGWLRREQVAQVEFDERLFSRYEL
jgi:L-alanine-DL-glutamate epimerase-like enolase superfamily enzyme